ncbi:MAG: ATP-binding protein [Acidimicrobiia bacterium]|jgi:two-component system phosphate regulon sensor histidine kinase PhoR
MSSRRGEGTNLSTRVLTFYAITYLVLIGLMGFIIERATQSALLEDVNANLEVAARLARESLPDSGDYAAWSERTFSTSGYRTTLIRVDGVVLADSHSNPAAMENHLSRPEVQSALDGVVGRAQRVSDSTGFEQRYVALPPVDGLIVRASVSTRVIADDLGTVRTSIILTAVGFGLVGVALLAILARRMTKPITELTDLARAVADGELDVETRRSRVRELDQLGLAISAISNRLGSRVSDAEEATATLEVVLGALPQGTVLFGEDEAVQYANPAARAILGVLPESLSGLAPLQLQTAVREAVESKTQQVRQVEHGSPTRRLRGIATPFSADNRVLLLVVDVTDRERADSVRRDFVANASHELKTPVSTIIASSEALQIALDRDDGSAGRFAGRIEGSARQLDRLVGDLLDLSRLEREEPEMAPTRLDHLVRDEVERIRAEADARGLRLTTQTEEITCSVNQRDVATAIRNILDNAVRYTMEGGSISVIVTAEDDEAVVSVSDTGEGIPTRDTERVFERFYRVDSARSRATGGTGLGLSIVKHVAESHGGTVSLESELGVGSTFTIRLPVPSTTESPTPN